MPASLSRQYPRQRTLSKILIHFLLMAVACLLFTPAAFAATNSCPAAEQAARKELDALHRLQSTPTKQNADDNDVVQPEQQAAIRAYKQTLVDTLDAQLACSDASIQAAELQKMLAVLIGQAPQRATTATNGPQFGANPNISVERTDLPHPLIRIRSGFGIPCGDDNVLVAYAWDQNRWQRVLRWQAGDYQDISGAYGDVFGSLALAEGQIAVVHGTPWCTSNLSRFEVDVIAPANGAAAQRTLFHTSHGYRRDFDNESDLLKLNRRDDGFEIRAKVMSLDPDLLIRPGIFRYAVANDTVRRVQPAANNGRNFVDEWLTIDDALARAWSDPEQATALSKARKPIAKDYVVSYGPVLACTREKRLYQVELDLSKRSSPSSAENTEEKRYVLIRQESNGFTAISLKNTADASCRGGDLMSRRAAP